MCLHREDKGNFFNLARFNTVSEVPMQCCYPRTNLQSIITHNTLQTRCILHQGRTRGGGGGSSSPAAPQPPSTEI
jgi:hypothetical protein